MFHLIFLLVFNQVKCITDLLSELHSKGMSEEIENILPQIADYLRAALKKIEGKVKN